MAGKRKDILELDAIENTRQRAVAKIVGTCLLEQGLSNNALADLSGISLSAVANIFRRQAKSLPGAGVLRSIAVGLSTDKDGAVDTQKAKDLYKELMNAADYDIRRNPFTFRVAGKKKLTEDDLQKITVAKIKQLPYKCKIDNIIVHMGEDQKETSFFDLTVDFDENPCGLAQWNFLFSINRQYPYVCVTRFVFTLFKLGHRKDGKYTIVTNNEDVYKDLLTLDFSDQQFYASVIIVAEDGSMEEKYIETALSHAELDENGLSF